MTIAVWGAFSFFCTTCEKETTHHYYGFTQVMCSVCKKVSQAH